MDLKFEVTEQEANLLLQALGELPARLSLNLINKLQIQAQQQVEQNNKSN